MPPGMGTQAAEGGNKRALSLANLPLPDADGCPPRWCYDSERGNARAIILVPSVRGYSVRKECCTVCTPCIGVQYIHTVQYIKYSTNIAIGSMYLTVIRTIPYPTLQLSSRVHFCPASVSWPVPVPRVSYFLSLLAFHLCPPPPSFLPNKPPVFPPFPASTAPWGPPPPPAATGLPQSSHHPSCRRISLLSARLRRP